MAEKITIEGQKVQLSNGRGEKHVVPVDRFARGVTESTARGMFPEPNPDNVKWRVACGPLEVCIVELKPELRWIKWLAPDSPAPYGPGATSQERQLATPYVVLKVPFREGALIPRVEVFYRNTRLTDLDGDGGVLYWANLLNVSPHAYNCTAWFCTQYIGTEGNLGGVTDGLNAVVHHLWGGMFNASSEEHEGISTHSLCVNEGVDKRVTEVDLWEAESKKNPKFVLSVDWKPVGITVRDLIEREFKVHRLNLAPDSAAAMGNIILRKQKAR